MSPKIKIGIIGGTGLENLDVFKNKVEKHVSTPFGNPSDVLIIGEINNVPCVLLPRHGRKHNISPSNVNYRANIWALKQEGCTHVIATNACGSLQEDIPPGNLVLLDNFIDRTTKREQTFYDGTTISENVCHIPMEPAFCLHTREVILQTAKSIAMDVRNGGTIVVIEGPRFSSKAESNLFRSWGAHLIGMTTVPEIVLAKEAGLCYACIGMATDYDCWRDTGEKVSHKYVQQIFKQNIAKIEKLLLSLIPRMAEVDWNTTIKKTEDLVTNSIIQ